MNWVLNPINSRCRLSLLALLKAEVSSKYFMVEAVIMLSSCIR